MSILKNLFGIQKKGTSPILLKLNPTVGGQQLKPKPIKDKKKK